MTERTGAELMCDGLAEEGVSLLFGHPGEPSSPAYAGGMKGMRAGVSDTAEYGEYVAGDRVVNEGSRKAMQEVLDEIRSGAFARRWIDESAAGGNGFKRMRETANTHLMEDVGERLRSRMAWL